LCTPAGADKALIIMYPSWCTQTLELLCAPVFSVYKQQQKKGVGLIIKKKQTLCAYSRLFLSPPLPASILLSPGKLYLDFTGHWS